VAIKRKIIDIKPNGSAYLKRSCSVFKLPLQGAGGLRLLITSLHPAFFIIGTAAVLAHFYGAVTKVIGKC
jgi:hypothetical protein